MIRLLVLSAVIYLARATITEVKVVFSNSPTQSQAIEGCPVEATCNYIQSAAKDVTYTWTDRTETTATITMAKLASTDNNSKWKCLVKDADNEVTATEVTLVVKANDDVSNKPNVIGAPGTGGTGDEVTLTCLSTYGGGCTMTYEWAKGGVTVAGETQSTIKVTTGNSQLSYTCKTVVNSVTSQESPAVNIPVGKDLSSVIVQGATKAVNDVEGTWTCAVTKSTSNSAGTVTYAWKNDASAEPAAETFKKTFSTVEAKTYGCGAKIGVGTEQLSPTKSVESAVTPATPTAAAPGTQSLKLSNGGDYTLTCTSESQGSYTETYVWKRGTDVLTDCTTKDCKISSPTTASAGAYTCQLKVTASSGTKDSTASAALTLAYRAEKGKICSALTDCFGDTYSGNCVASLCQCKNNGPVTPDGCEVGSPGVRVTFSLALIVMAAVGGMWVKH